MGSLKARSRILLSSAMVSCAALGATAAQADCLPNASGALVTCETASARGYQTTQDNVTIEVVRNTNVTGTLSAGKGSTVSNEGTINVGAGNTAISLGGGGRINHAATATGNLTGNMTMGDTSGDQVNTFLNRGGMAGSANQGVFGNFSSTGKTNFTNEGVFTGNITTGAGDDAVYNYGTINGTIALGGGNNILGISAQTNVNANTVVDNSGGGTYTLDLGGNDPATFNLPLWTGFTNITKSGSSTWTIASPILVSGSVTVNSGILNVNDADFLGGDTVVNNSTVQFNGMAAGTYSGAMSGKGNVIIGSGTAPTTFSGSNTYSGGTSIQGGTLIVTGGSALSDTGDVKFSSAGGLFRVSQSETIGSLNNDAPGEGATTTVSLDKGATLTVGSGAYTQVISGEGALAKNTTGTLTLTGPNTYSGGTTVSAGTLVGTTTSLQGNIVDNATVSFNQSANGTYAGNLSGSGVVSYDGAGTVTMSGGEVSNTGATKVNKGTLVAGGKGVGDSSALTVAQGATFRLAGNETIGSLAGAGAVDNAAFTLTTGGDNTSTTYSGAMTGTGLTKTGTGTFTLSGTNTLSGAFATSAGASTVTGSTTAGSASVANGATVNVNSGGSLKASTVTIAAGGKLADNGTVTGTVSNAGTLSGSGTVVGALTNSGTLSPGNSPGIFTVTGSYTQTSSGTLATEISNSNVAGTGYDQLKVNGTPGTAALNGTLAITGTKNVLYVDGTTYDVVTATGGISGDFSSITGATLSPFISFTDTGVVSTGGTSQAYRQTLKRTSYADGINPGATRNQTTVATGFQGLVDGATGDAATAVTTVDFMTVDQARQFFDEASPEPYGAYVTALQDQGNLWERQIRLRLINIQLKKEISNAIWMNGYGQWGKSKERKNRYGSRQNIYGLAGGVDFGKEDFTFGVSGGYSKAKNRYRFDNALGNRGSRGNSKSWQAGGYAAFDYKKIAFGVTGGYIHSKVRAHRSVVLDNDYNSGSADSYVRTAYGRPKGHQWKITATGGYDIGLDRWAMLIRPFVGVDTTHGRIKGFTETGADSLNLTVRRQRAGRTDVMGGLNITGMGRKFAPYARLIYRYRVGGGAKYNISAAFNGESDTSFTIRALRPGKSQGDVDVGFSYDLLGKATIYVGYEGQFRKDMTRYGATGGIRVNF